MMNRRQWLGLTAGAGAALALNPRMLSALRTRELISRAVPSSGELLPVVGLGSSATSRSAYCHWRRTAASPH